MDNFYDTGLFPSLTIWKRIVKTAVQSNEVKMWTSRINSDDDFSAFKVIHKTYEPHAAWSVALRHPHLRPQAHFLVSICCLIRNFKNNEVVLCDRCGKLFSDPIVHAVASCDYLEKIRDKFWCDVININPITFSIYLANMSDNELCNCLLSCDSGDFHLDSKEQETFQTLCVRYI